MSSRVIVHLEKRIGDSQETIQKYIDYLCNNLRLDNYILVVSPLHNPKFSNETYYLATDESYYTLEQIPSMIDNMLAFGKS